MNDISELVDRINPVDPLDCIPLSITYQRSIPLSVVNPFEERLPMEFTPVEKALDEVKSQIIKS